MVEATSRHPDGALAHQASILVIDDQPDIRTMVVELLQEEGYSVLEGSDGRDGLDLLRSPVPVDLLITDVGLPGGPSGREVAAIARAGRPGLKVIFMTGHTEDALLEAGELEHGMQVITKPFSISTLADKVAEMLTS